MTTINKTIPVARLTLLADPAQPKGKYKPQRKRSEWVTILEDMQAQSLTKEQVSKMYNVSLASIQKWQSVFKMERLDMVKTEDKVADTIKKSIAALNKEFSDNVGYVLTLENRQNDIVASINRLEKSLELLKLTEDHK